MWKIYLYFSIGIGQRRELGLCQLYWHTFLPYNHDGASYTYNDKWRSNNAAAEPTIKISRKYHTKFHVHDEHYVLWTQFCKILQVSRVTLSSNILKLTANGSELPVIVNALTVFNSPKIRLQPDDSDSSWHEQEPNLQNILRFIMRLS